MRIITAPENYVKEPNDICVFLAGGITNCPDWQSEVLEKLANTTNNDNLVIFNPRRDNFDVKNPNESIIQITWEFKMLEMCDIFSMYFCGDTESDQPICFYELGRNIARMQMKYPGSWEDRIIVSSDKKFKRYKDVQLQTLLATNNNVKINKMPEDIYSHYVRISTTYSRFNNSHNSDGNYRAIDAMYI